jgi:hypothetical protein
MKGDPAKSLVAPFALLQRNPFRKHVRAHFRFETIFDRKK